MKQEEALAVLRAAGWGCSPPPPDMVADIATVRRWITHQDGAAAFDRILARPRFIPHDERMCARCHGQDRVDATAFLCVRCDYDLDAEWAERRKATVADKADPFPE